MVDKQEKMVSPTEDVELNVQITESKDGSLEVGYAMFRAGTQERVYPRPAHVVGLLHCAATFVEMRKFPTLQEKTEQPKHKDKK